MGEEYGLKEGNTKSRRPEDPAKRNTLRILGLGSALPFLGLLPGCVSQIYERKGKNASYMQDNGAKRSPGEVVVYGASAEYYAPAFETDFDSEELEYGQQSCDNFGTKAYGEPLTHRAARKPRGAVETILRIRDKIIEMSKEGVPLPLDIDFGYKPNCPIEKRKVFIALATQNLNIAVPEEEPCQEPRPRPRPRRRFPDPGVSFAAYAILRFDPRVTDITSASDILHVLYESVEPEGSLEVSPMSHIARGTGYNVRTDDLLIIGPFKHRRFRAEAINLEEKYPLMSEVMTPRVKFRQIFDEETLKRYLRESGLDKFFE